MLTLSVVLKSKHSANTADQIIELLNKVPQEALKTLTIDNGLEFADHQHVARDLEIEVFLLKSLRGFSKRRY